MDSSSKNYLVRVYSQTSLAVPSIDAISTWSNVGSGTSWTSTPSVNLVGVFAVSKYWATNFTLFSTCIYYFHLVLTVPTSLLYFRIVSLDASNNLVEVLYETGGSVSATITVAPTINANKIAFVASSDDAGGTESVTVNIFSLSDFAIELTETALLSGSKYEFSFIPDSFGFCGLQYEFRMIDKDSGNEVAHTDCIDITNDNGNCTELIQYANSTDFAGLDFSNTSPRDYFYLRVPVVFFEEDNPQEQEDLELSDDTIVTLWSKIEGKKTLDIGFMPFYMHLKLQLALMMDDVTIDGVPYRMRDPYQRTPPSSKRSALRRASVILSQKNFIDRNLL